ncbi:hypothetical protein Clacol_007430 [Clathrus columnatus]|uniref:Ankyrin repeat domain-containing protein n=1 Tax=Clathrus columnatus TaxID=1419009 RepID=A0AAV5AKF9_9AGAM|nr:hypothetical protein Clacol_007430 [Clathrus columnatus]
MSDEKGASGNEVLLAAARDDNVDLLLDLFKKPDTFDINYQDGAQYGSLEALEHLLSYENCDVDLQNRLERDTPLLSAIKSTKIDVETRNEVVKSLLEAGADIQIKDKGNFTIKDLLSLKTNDANKELLIAIRKAEAQAIIPQTDIADNYDEEGDYTDSGSGSEEEG